MTDLNKIVGTWPGSKDDGFEKDIQEARHGYPPWQPMKTAPMDESRFFLCYKLKNEVTVRTARYYAHARYWTTSHCEIVWDIRDGEISVSQEFEGELLGWMQPELPTEVVK